MKHYPNALPKEDMFLAGIQGLLVAAEKFDPSLGYRFTTFAVHAIRSHLRRAIQRMGALICPPVKRTNVSVFGLPLGHESQLAVHECLSFLSFGLSWSLALLTLCERQSDVCWRTEA